MPREAGGVESFRGSGPHRSFVTSEGISWGFCPSSLFFLSKKVPPPWPDYMQRFNFQPYEGPYQGGILHFQVHFRIKFANNFRSGDHPHMHIWGLTACDGPPVSS